MYEAEGETPAVLVQHADWSEAMSTVVRLADGAAAGAEMES